MTTATITAIDRFTHRATRSNSGYYCAECTRSDGAKTRLTADKRSALKRRLLRAGATSEMVAAAFATERHVTASGRTV